jgi:hypothetical protein
MRTVFPSTSSSAWTSSLTGADVATHGIPGVVFKVDETLINVFDHRGELHAPDTGNLFVDAVAAGYEPISIVGDCEPFDCSWRTLLLEGSHWLRGHRFFTADPSRTTDEICVEVQRAVTRALGSESLKPKLVWCFIDADRAIHHRGYDDEAMRFLRRIDEIATELARNGAIVVAYSDHGLTSTIHEPAIAEAFARLPAERGYATGGAGRTRWIYSDARGEDGLVAALQRALPSTIRIASADEVFAAGSLARTRVGNVVLIAEGEEFMTFDGQRFEHGSSTDMEIDIPFAEWVG